MYPSQRTQTPGPFTINYPDPSTAYCISTPGSAFPGLKAIDTPSFTFTPPQSAHPSEEQIMTKCSFTSRLSAAASPLSQRTPRRRATTGGQYLEAPYTHPRSLHSILRNSPLPPRNQSSPVSPSRASQRLADRANKTLCFNNPLTQTITNDKYLRSHIDLLAEEASPYSPLDPENGTLETLDLAMAYSGDETRDGGQTPGPFEEMRRRMAGLAAESDTETPGSKKRKRKEKKRRWVWTIGTNEDDSEGSQPTPITAEQGEVVETLLPTVYVETSRDTEMEMIGRPSLVQYI